MKKILLFTFFIGLNILNGNAQLLLPMYQKMRLIREKNLAKRDSINNVDSITLKKLKLINAQLETYEKLVSQESQREAPSFKLRNDNEFNKYTFSDVNNVPTPKQTLQQLLPPMVEKYNSQYYHPYKKWKLHEYDNAIQMLISKDPKKVKKGEKLLYKLADCSFWGVAEAANYQLLLLNSIGMIDVYFIPSLAGATPKELINRVSSPSSIILKLNVNNINRTYKKKIITNAALPDKVKFIIEAITAENLDAINLISFNPSFVEAIAYEYFLQSKKYSTLKSPDIRATLVKSYYSNTLKLEDLPVYVNKLSILYPYISSLDNAGQLPDIGLTGMELYLEGEKWEKKWENEDDHTALINSIFYYSRSALYGYSKGMKALLGLYAKYCSNEKGLSNRLYYTHLYKTLCENLSKIEKYNQYTYLKSIVEKSNIMYEDAKDQHRDYERRERIREAEKRQQKRQIWADVIQGVGMAMVGVANQMAVQQMPTMKGYNTTQRIRTDSELHQQWQSDLNQIFHNSIAEVNSQEYARYQAARETFQRWGRDLSVSEWRAMEGQAILDMKEQGYDIIAEQKKMNQENKAFEEKLRKEERQQRLERNKALSSRSVYESTGKSNSSSIYSSSSNNKTISYNNIETKKTSGINYDSREQYKSEAVSSDDYYYVKHVTLYIRDANSNRIMFSNKDLCKKGAYYYVKIDNKYYSVNVQGGWGFNSSISYGHDKLYFNM